jgi:hypothetical protein
MMLRCRRRKIRGMEDAGCRTRKNILEGKIMVNENNKKKEKCKDVETRSSGKNQSPTFLDKTWTT